MQYYTNFDEDMHPSQVKLSAASTHILAATRGVYYGAIFSLMRIQFPRYVSNRYSVLPIVMNQLKVIGYIPSICGLCFFTYSFVLQLSDQPDKTHKSARVATAFFAGGITAGVTSFIHTGTARAAMPATLWIGLWSSCAVYISDKMLK